MWQRSPSDTTSAQLSSRNQPQRHVQRPARSHVASLSNANCICMCQQAAANHMLFTVQLNEHAMPLQSQDVRQ